jgi:hypothetical protein
MTNVEEGEGGNDGRAGRNDERVYQPPEGGQLG